MNHPYFEGLKEKTDGNTSCKIDLSKSKSCLRGKDSLPNTTAAAQPQQIVQTQIYNSKFAQQPKAPAAPPRKSDPDRAPGTQSPDNLDRKRASSKFGKIEKEKASRLQPPIPPQLPIQTSIFL